ncbi:MAG: gluconate 2-dehydrogenase subunit 3 family protein [Spirosoma sp.]|nr:gluconate 2-dehydrogenase subunit 3 family protein [Spirosoma sp.]
MQRRSALKNVAVAFGGLISLPAWASGWTAESLGSVATLSLDQESLLAEIVETFIPETDTPGAKATNVHKYAMRIIRDCYGPAAQQSLEQGLALTDATARQLHGKGFADGDATQRMAVLTIMAASTDPAGKAFVELMKPLTIRGYTSSEYYLVNVKKYVMAPGFYHGCVSIPA